MPEYKFTIASVISAQTEDEAMMIFREDLDQIQLEDLLLKVEVEEITE